MNNLLKPGVTFLLFIFRLQNYPSLGFEPVVLFEVAGSIPIRAIRTSLSNKYCKCYPKTIFFKNSNNETFYNKIYRFIKLNGII